MLLPDPSCPGATRLTLVDTTWRSLGSMDAWGDSRLTSPLPEGLLPPEDPPEELPPGETAAAPEPLELPETPVHAVYLHRCCCARVPWRNRKKNRRNCLRSRDRLNRNLLSKILVRWRNRFPLSLWNSLSQTGRSRI